MEGKLKINFDGEDKLFLHKQIGEGELPDGRKLRLLQTNTHIVMAVTDKNSTKNYSCNYMDLSDAFIQVIEKNKTALTK